MLEHLWTNWSARLGSLAERRRQQHREEEHRERVYDAFERAWTHDVQCLNEAHHELTPGDDLRALRRDAVRRAEAAGECLRPLSEQVASRLHLDISREELDEVVPLIWQIVVARGGTRPFLWREVDVLRRDDGSGRHEVVEADYEAPMMDPAKRGLVASAIDSVLNVTV